MHGQLRPQSPRLPEAASWVPAPQARARFAVGGSCYAAARLINPSSAARKNTATAARAIEAPAASSAW